MTINPKVDGSIELKNGLNTILTADSSGKISYLNAGALPTTNPNIAGAVWNDVGTLKVSTGV
jgi:hypothetical protein